MSLVQAICRWLLARNTRFISQTIVCELVAVKKNVAMEEGFLCVLQIPLSVSLYQFPIHVFVTHNI